VTAQAASGLEEPTFYAAILANVTYFDPALQKSRGNEHIAVAVRRVFLSAHYRDCRPFNYWDEIVDPLGEFRRRTYSAKVRLTAAVVHLFVQGPGAELLSKEDVPDSSVL